ncbi:hypothetical protein [Embleya sp. MST-111070]|uniref:hypothetical protein n=1 Tax=Embleya sp. MST-111070 TaxID=3398231 RepID=UPI003F736CFA
MQADATEQTGEGGRATPGRRPKPQASTALLYAATSPDVRGGDFIGPDGFAELRGAPTRVSLARAASDADTGRRLWQLSEDLTGVHFPIPEPSDHPAA